MVREVLRVPRRSHAERMARMHRAIRIAVSHVRRRRVQITPIHVHVESRHPEDAYSTSYSGEQGCSLPTAEESLEFAYAIGDAGKLVPFVILLIHILQQGPHMGLITRAEELFRGHRALLVEFNKYLPEESQCSVPPEEVN